MKKQLPFSILPQPTETTCGPTCLHAVYNYYNDPISLGKVIDEVTAFDEGGTLAVFLGCHALSRGYRAQIYTYNLQVFDPSWFTNGEAVPDLREKLLRQGQIRTKAKIKLSIEGYVDFLSRGGRIRYHDLNSALIRKYLKRGTPIITGLSSTYLHRAPRENPQTFADDPIGGVPVGHFVVLYGYDRDEKVVNIAEPLFPNPLHAGQYYQENIDRVICSILLGIVTHDANLLIIERNGDVNSEPDSCK